MTLRKSLAAGLLLFPILPAIQAQTAAPTSVFGYRDFSAEAKVEEKFLAVPDAKLAGEALKTLTAEPHLAGTPEDHKTAEYVAQKFRSAGLDTEIVPYRVLMNQPKTVKVEAFGPDGKLLMTGPKPEHVPGDPFDDNPRIVMPFNGSSGSGDVTGDVVYANYGRLEDFDQLAADHIDLHGKIVITRYGSNFRGVKVYIAEQRGAAGVLIYSDPQDDGYFKGDTYPQGPWRPDSGVQRGSVQYLFKYPGDPETPGVASTLDLPDSARVNPEGNQPHIIFFLAIIGFSYSHWFALSACLAFFEGFSGILMVSCFNVSIQHLSSDEMRGRIMSIYATSFLGLPPLGALLAGELSRHIPTGHALAAMAGTSLLIFIGFFSFSPALRSLD